MAEINVNDFFERDNVSQEQLDEYTAQLKSLIRKQYFNGQDIKVYACNKVEAFKVRLDDVQYIQITPVQNIQPVYNVFEEKPAMLLHGHKLIQGTIGFNFVFADIFDQIVGLSDQHEFGQQKKFETDFGLGLYLERLKIVFQKNLSIQWYYPVINLDDVYIFGGSVQQAPDQTPVQDVYYFVALSINRQDKIKTVEVSPKIAELPTESFE